MPYFMLSYWEILEELKSMACTLQNCALPETPCPGVTFATTRPTRQTYYITSNKNSNKNLDSFVTFIYWHNKHPTTFHQRKHINEHINNLFKRKHSLTLTFLLLSQLFSLPYIFFYDNLAITFKSSFHYKSGQI